VGRPSEEGAGTGTGRAGRVDGCSRPMAMMGEVGEQEPWPTSTPAMVDVPSTSMTLTSGVAWTSSMGSTGLGSLSTSTGLLKSRWATGAAMGLGSAVCSSCVATVSGPEDGVPGMDRTAIGGAEDQGISGNGSCREGAGGVRMEGAKECGISGNASCREGVGGVTVGGAERHGITGNGS
jgi:hypothetical protein